MNKILVFCLLLCCGISARAATLVVDRTDDADVSACSSASNDCTLRGAINRANGNTGGDIISFAGYDSIIGLTRTLPTITDAAGLAIDARAGFGAEIKGDGGTYRIFNITQGASLALFNVTLTKGNPADFGGAIYNAGTLSLSICKISDNNATRGGGIYNAGGSITAEYCTFWFNNASEGGAIFNATTNGDAGTVTASDTTFTGNIAAAGGAMANSATLILRRCSLDFNQAKGSPNDASFGGGGIYNDGTFALESSTSYHNESNSYGGGVLNRSALTVRSCTFSQDASPQGGAVAYAGASTTFGNTIFDAAGIGNVVSLPETASTLSSEGFNISSDATGPNSSFDRINTNPKLSEYFVTPTSRAGYVAIRRDSPAADGGYTTISSDVAGQPRPFDLPNIPNAPGSNGADVGAYEIQNAPPLFKGQFYDVRLNTATDIQLQASDAEKQPLLFTLDPATPLPPGLNLSSRGRIIGTVSDESLQYIYVTVTVEDDVDAVASATIRLHIIEPGSLIVNTTGADDELDGKTTLREAMAFAQVDGTDRPVTFDPFVFAAPRKQITSGKISLLDGEPVMVQAPSAGVEVRGDGPAGLFFVGVKGSLTLRGLLLTGGRSYNGGSIAAQGVLSVEECTFANNQAVGSGGAIYIFSDVGDARAKVTIRNSTFSGNGADNLGGAICNRSSLLTLNSVTIVNSNVRISGGGVASYGDDQTQTIVTNCIIAGNISGGATNDVQFVQGRNNTFQSSGYNLIGIGNATSAFNAGGDSTGANVTTIAPLAENGGPTPTRALLPGSPAIDAGSTDLTIDQRGQMRPQGAASDIGAFESGFVRNKPPMLENATFNTERNIAFSQQLAGTDADDDALFYRVIAGTLPAGLRLKGRGLLAGKPTTIGSEVVTVEVSDGKGGTGTANITINVTAPFDLSAPLLLRATGETGQILLNWDDRAKGETGYKIERLTNGKWSLIARGTTPQQTSYVDKNVAPGVTYSYRVSAYVYGAATGAPSNVASAQALNNPLATPSSLSATARIGYVTLHWRDNASGETGYRVERSLGNSDNWIEILRGTTPNQTSFVDSSVSAGATYRYRVLAYKYGVGKGAPCPPITVVVPANFTITPALSSDGETTPSSSVSPAVSTSSASS